MDKEIEIPFEKAKEICWDIGFPFRLAILEFAYSLENKRIELLRPSREQMQQWRKAENGLAKFASFLEEKTKRVWTGESVFKLWEIYRMERRSSPRVSHRDPVMIRNFMKHGTNCCQHCGERIAQIDAEVDHIIPVTRGGSSAKSNLQVLCRNCNRRKGDNLWILL